MVGVCRGASEKRSREAGQHTLVLRADHHTRPRAALGFNPCALRGSLFFLTALPQATLPLPARHEAQPRGHPGQRHCGPPSLGWSPYGPRHEAH